jgi:hypothetical protein
MRQVSGLDLNQVEVCPYKGFRYHFPVLLGKFRNKSGQLTSKNFCSRASHTKFGSKQGPLLLQK